MHWMKGYEMILYPGIDSVKLRLHVSVICRPLSVIHHPSKRRWCVSMCPSALCVFWVLYKVVCTCCVIFTALSTLDMAWLFKLSQLEQEHEG